MERKSLISLSHLHLFVDSVKLCYINPMCLYHKWKCMTDLICPLSLTEVVEEGTLN